MALKQKFFFSLNLENRLVSETIKYKESFLESWVIRLRLEYDFIFGYSVFPQIKKYLLLSTLSVAASD